jgi:hypothetical protein
VILVAVLEYFGRVPSCDAKGRDILDHYTAGLNDSPFAYCHSAQNANIHAYPNIFANFDVLYFHRMVIGELCALIIMELCQNYEAFPRVKM